MRVNKSVGIAGGSNRLDVHIELGAQTWVIGRIYVESSGVGTIGDIGEGCGGGIGGVGK